MELKKYEYIDSLRGIAILMVIFGHAACLNREIFCYFPTPIVAFFETIGGIGVRLFFVVSAFTLMMSYQNRKNEKHATRNFFIRRYFRIAPIYYLAILFFSFVAIGFTLTNPSWGDLPKRSMITSFLFISGFFPSTLNNYVLGGWSIAIEFMFYFALPFLALRIKSVNSSILFVLISLLVSTILGYILKDTALDKNGFLFYFIFNHLPIFGLGMLAYWLKNEKQYVVKPIVLLTIACVVFIYTYIQIVFAFIPSIACFLLLLVLSNKPYKLLSNRFFATIGKVSFSLYLMHFVIMQLAGRYGYYQYLPNTGNINSSILYILIAFIGLTFVSYWLSLATYKLIEMPCQNLGKKIITKLNN